jgi:ariadne-1
MSYSGDESDGEYQYMSGGEDGDDASYQYDDDETMDVPASPAPTKSNGKGNLSHERAGAAYRILDYEAVENTMKRVVGNVASVLEVDPDQAQLLLSSVRWDEERLIESYFADSEKVCKEAGVDLLDGNMVQKDLQSRNSVPPFLCKICYDDQATDGFNLGCGHQFCNSCYEGFLRNQISEGPLCVLARCPAFKCTQAVPASVYRAYLKSDEKATYNRYAVRQFIEANKAYRYCPAPNCERVSLGSGETHVVCDCGHQYCFHCGAEDHRPCNCATLSKWVDKCNNDSETANWMSVNTKPCPKCVSRIEKNQGCNHMTCRQCKHEFCWLCFGDWRGHSTCNRFNPQEKGVDAADVIQKKKLTLERYMHYYKRYQNHDIAEKFAEKQRSKTEGLLKSLQEQDALAMQDAQCIRDAAEQVIHCRRVLKYTYVIGFYLDDAALNKQLFERHQEMLEENTERLQEFIETKKLKNLDRTELINYTRITERFRNSLLEDIHDEANMEAAHLPPPPPPPLGSAKSSKGTKRSSSGAVSASTTGASAAAGVATRSRSITLQQSV